jgi:hypothetical protein
MRARRTRLSAARILWAVPPQTGGGEAAEQREPYERPEAGDRSGARPGGAERRLAQRDRADARVGPAQAHSADPPRGLIGAVGGA